jgi:hypothetical protein
MKPPEGSAPAYVAAALLGAMSLAFIYQGFSKSSPPSFLGAAILLVGVWLAIRRAMRRRGA